MIVTLQFELPCQKLEYDYAFNGRHAVNALKDIRKMVNEAVDSGQSSSPEEIEKQFDEIINYYELRV